ncbi:MAG: radical SAM protein [Candidatus Gracilibacteria bacterium]|nr:radical SAM protein [Candidatus Gracilibacteria bacterium]MDD4530208.1 radical SAM protein [Candidatus Gracilibacteria bacterium]
MPINQIIAKSIITKSNLPDSDFVINPYVGCTHSCIYCYARFMKRFSGHDEERGKFLDVKINAPDLIDEKALRKISGKKVFISSVTDPYIQAESKFQVTRKILEKLVDSQAKIGIQTKSDLILRDIDIIKKLKNVEVGLTMTTFSDGLRKVIEPFASSPVARKDALIELKKRGIKTYVFIGPILPFLTNWKMIIDFTKGFTDYYIFENLNIKGSIWTSIKIFLQKYYPELLPKYEEIYFTKNDYWDKVEDDIKNFCGYYAIDHRIYFHHSKKNVKNIK